MNGLAGLNKSSDLYNGLHSLRGIWVEGLKRRTVRKGLFLIFLLAFYKIAASAMPSTYLDGLDVITTTAADVHLDKNTLEALDRCRDISSLCWD
ncbi:hypothetical protein F5Y12DRAFT_717979 [Xylaria sp. FL1777]|nr:hypothetical protein F5Y12DRAFT_717979 [Xylaria sp. FL1777]